MHTIITSKGSKTTMTTPPATAPGRSTFRGIVVDSEELIFSVGGRRGGEDGVGAT